MKTRRKYLAWFASAGFVMAVAVPSHAFTSKGLSISTASVTVGGGSAAMSVAIFNMNGVGASSVTWSASAGGPWTVANQYLQIASTLTVAGAGIQTYTQNSGGLYTGTASSTTAAGLVNLQNTKQTIPMAWEVSTGTYQAPDDPNNTGVGHTGWAWFYYADKGGGLLGNAPGNWYIQVENAGNPPQIQFAQSSFGAGNLNGINKLFLEANFANAVGGNTYQTNTLTLELFTQ
jgi:hypothetical protein